ncbi:hypothetical protein [Maritimibacter sp. UBA3975]|uniref:hypothetical protein n=1 Tax=Maritimibacter sp. UBA3975 TaxID=1946833 RepID=UPI000C09779F|nr:hypothetical protein [Maritimibacter sp. UBA3975]MAM62303.1 hypothetical protein [Maritimibacter sp.]|tara:strand:- start:4104 stop:4325 length:222 start_codon:yes stop_codon:yes gene_type:complete
MKHGWRLLLIPLWALCAAGVVVIAGLAVGFMTWVTFAVAAVIGLAIGIPAGLWNTHKIKREDPDWDHRREIPA